VHSFPARNCIQGGCTGEEIARLWYKLMALIPATEDAGDERAFWMIFDKPLFFSGLGEFIGANSSCSTAIWIFSCLLLVLLVDKNDPRLRLSRSNIWTRRNVRNRRSQS
jgi:hypothetical protein